MLMQTASLHGVSSGTIGLHVLYGVQFVLWLACLSFTAVPWLGLLPALQSSGARRRPALNFRSILVISLVFGLATVDFACAVAQKSLSSPAPAPSTAAFATRWFSLYTVRGITFLIVTLIAMSDLCHRLYVVSCQDTRFLVLPATTMLAATICGGVVAPWLVSPLEMSSREKGLTVSFYTLFAVDYLACAITIATLLLRHIPSIHALLRLRNPSFGHMLRDASIHSLPFGFDAEMEREFCLLSRIELGSAGLYALLNGIHLILYLVGSPTHQFLLQILPQGTAVCYTLSKLQTAMSSTYNFINILSDAADDPPRFAKGTRHSAGESSFWGDSLDCVPQLCRRCSQLIGNQFGESVHTI